LKDLIETVGSRFLDLLVFDALYLQTPFTAEVEALGLDWVGNLKENQPELLAEAQRVTAGAPEVHSQETSRAPRGCLGYFSSSDIQGPLGVSCYLIFACKSRSPP
jgi:hypothetical protein